MKNKKLISKNATKIPRSQTHPVLSLLLVLSDFIKNTLPKNSFMHTLMGGHSKYDSLNKRRTFSLNSLFKSLSTYLGIAVVIVVGTIKEFFGNIFKRITNQNVEDFCTKNNRAPLFGGFDDFFIRRIYAPQSDCWGRKIHSAPDVVMDVEDSYSRRKPVIVQNCINMGSYNYLGFASTESPTLPAVFESIENLPVSTSYSRGTADFSQTLKLESLLIRRTGKEAAAVFPMGFACNTSFLSFLLRKGDLVLSDSKNHSSIVNGCFAANAEIKVFNHNDPTHLEELIRESIVKGQKRTNRPFRRIFILIEGLYSMEGYYPKLREIVELKKKYKCYLFIDEAHSFGGVGKTGKGVCEQLGVDPDDVEIIMGTFTKSFCAFGGFIASSKELIAELRETCGGYRAVPSVAPSLCAQISAAMEYMEAEGLPRVRKLHENANYLREGLKREGLEILGEKDSPVVVVMARSNSAICAISRECLKQKIAVVVAGFPATSLLGSRVRFCVSAKHSKEQLQHVIQVLSEICGRLGCKY